MKTADRTWEYRVYGYWGRIHRPHARQLYVAELVGPWTDQGLGGVIACSVPGAVSKLANTLRKSGLGKLDPYGVCGWAVQGLNR